MKLLNLAFVGCSLLSANLLSASAIASVDSFYCNRGNGGYSIEFTNNIKQALFILVNASGVQDARGNLSCSGPQESAYVCSGNVQYADSFGMPTGPRQFFRLVIPESTLQIGQGQIEIGSTSYNCSPETSRIER